FKLLKETAELIIPNFVELINYDEKREPLSTHILSNEFPILQDSNFQMNYLPLIQDLLSDESKKDTSEIILFLLDLLSRMNPTTLPLTKNVFRNLNWVLSNNIFRLEREYQSNQPSFGGISSADAYDRQKDRDYKDIQADSEQLIEEISVELKKIVELNYKEFREKKYKSIF